ncbi:MAG: J domain-containing protein, partial [Thiohalospira sp.]
FEGVEDVRHMVAAWQALETEHRRLHRTAAELDALLAAFWRRYHAHARRDWALRELALAADATRETIRRRYRELAMDHHPDRGGDAERFARINAAHAVLVGLPASVGGATPAREGDA